MNMSVHYMLLKFRVECSHLVLTSVLVSFNRGVNGVQYIWEDLFCTRSTLDAINSETVPSMKYDRKTGEEMHLK